MYVVKIGGSLITHKDEYCRPNREVIRSYAKVIKEYWDELQGKLIIILGGGSYGNGVPLRYNIDDSKNNWKHEDLLMMTTKMFEWMTEVTTIFRSEGLPCYPFQGSSYISTDDGNLNTCFIKPIKDSLRLRLLPILSGDLTFDSSKRFVIFSSDKIPQVLNKEIDITRVVMLTNVDGIHYKHNSSQIFKNVTRENYPIVLAETGSSKQQDVTGGMRTKVLSLIELAEQGIMSVICNGKQPNNLIDSIFKEEPPGTKIEAWKVNCV